MSSLLLLSLGPIQDFIASARSCQDLWFGSHLLSDLSRAVAEAMPEGALIFPGSTSDEGGRPAVANKILARVTGDFAKVAADAKLALDRALDGHFERLRSKLEGVEWEEAAAKAQIEDLIELVWVAVPCSGTDDYRLQRQRAEELLAARKASRNWRPVTWGAEVPKSAHDGLRESVIPEAAFKRQDLSAKKLWERYKVRPAERLCGVGLLKRWGAAAEPEGDDGARRPAFHSASHIAAAPLLTRARRLGKLDALSGYFEYLHSLGGGILEEHRLSGNPRKAPPVVAKVSSPLDARSANLVPRAFSLDGAARALDGYLLFEDRLTEILELAGMSNESAQKEAQKEARPKLRQGLAALGWREPVCPYYAVLLADGDRMGQTIDKLETYPRHQKLSRALDRFASACRPVVDDHGGSLVYAGGDDVFALVPLHTALACAKKLHEAFHEHVAPACDGIDVPTLSVGLAISHHLTPFSEARALAKRAEQRAKRPNPNDRDEKNGLAIFVEKRSGDTLEWVRSWKDAPTERIERWAKLLYEEAVPDSVAYELEREVTRLRFGETSDDLRPAVASLVRRTVSRRRAERGEEALSAGARAWIEEGLDGRKDLWDAVLERSVEIQIARAFLDGYRMAWEDKS